jgi:hypothetical protein
MRTGRLWHGMSDIWDPTVLSTRAVGHSITDRYCPSRDWVVEACPLRAFTIAVRRYTRWAYIDSWRGALRSVIGSRNRLCAADRGTSAETDGRRGKNKWKMKVRDTKEPAARTDFCRSISQALALKPSSRPLLAVDRHLRTAVSHRRFGSIVIGYGPGFQPPPLSAQRQCDVTNCGFQLLLLLLLLLL